MFRYVKLTDQLLFQLDFQNVDQHTGGKWLIHDTNTEKKRKQLQSLELRPRIS